MTELISTIKEIVKYGLEPNLAIDNKEILLEKALATIYYLSFEIKFDFDETNYPDFDKSNLPDIRRNVQSNFKDFGYYKTVLDIYDVANLQDFALGDAIDDLNDIIIDLLEIEWRIKNNSLADGLWFFNFIFRAHTQQHILDLLNFIKQKNS